ncbi:acyltransferase [Aeromonas veronii]|uniref:acyltransferase n=1 Tax=Aeromonas veronii TaxID=654 RepID=UPI0038B52457
MYSILFFLYQVYASVKRAIKISNIRAKLYRLGCYCSTSAVININSWENVTVECNVSIGHGTIIIVSDEKSFVGLQSSLKIGYGTAINEYCNIRAAGGDIIIGKNCMLAQFVTIVASNHIIDCDGNMIDQQWDNSNITVEIGDNTWIGAGAIILPGVRIGNGCVIGAGSVVTTDVMDNQVVVGVPARFIRMRKNI